MFLFLMFVFQILLAIYRIQKIVYLETESYNPEKRKNDKEGEKREMKT